MLAAVRGRQCVISAVAAGSSAAVMFPPSSLMMNILCSAVVMGAGTTMFLICPATNFLVDKNSIMYGLHTNIIPQYGYKGTN